MNAAEWRPSTARGAPGNAMETCLAAVYPHGMILKDLASCV